MNSSPVKNGIKIKSLGYTWSIAVAMRVGWYSEVKPLQVMQMLLTNRKTLSDKQIDMDNVIRGTLRVIGIKVSG
ncbi:MAG: hypothetical protein ACK5II_06295 [Paracoccus sp. (in: a-proteobacteria)]